MFLRCLKFNYGQIDSVTVCVTTHSKGPAWCRLLSKLFQQSEKSCFIISITVREYRQQEHLICGSVIWLMVFQHKRLRQETREVIK